MEQNIFDVSDDISFPWLPAYAEATEANPLNGSTGSRMLETIVEETSDDDDGREKDRDKDDDDDDEQEQQQQQQQPLSWSQYDHVWSSGGSDAESVIRVETPSDQDTMSERDFICPPKRRKQETPSFGDEFLSSDLAIYGRRPRICVEPDGLETNEYFMKRHNEQRLRFDEIGHDLFADSDSLSYASLSRSSSLIQFESLERQLQNETSVSQHPLSGSSPSLYSSESNSLLAPGGGDTAGVIGTGAARAADALGFYAVPPGARGKGGAGPGLGQGSNLLTTSNLIQKSIGQSTALNISDSELYSTSSSVSSSSSSSSGGSSCGSGASGVSGRGDSSSNASSTGSSGYRYASDECNVARAVARESSSSGRIATESPEDTGDTEEELLSATVRGCSSTRCSERRQHSGGATCRGSTARNKNSIESLSEDSGYCDHLHVSMSGMRVRSKSLTNFGSAENITFICGSGGAVGGGLFEQERQQLPPSVLLPAAGRASLSMTQPHQHHHQHQQQPLSMDYIPVEPRHVSFSENRLSTVCDVDEEEEEQEEEDQTDGRTTIERNQANGGGPPTANQQQPCWTNINNGTKIEHDLCKQQSAGESQQRQQQQQHQTHHHPPVTTRLTPPTPPSSRGSSASCSGRSSSASSSSSSSAESLSRTPMVTTLMASRSSEATKNSRRPAARRRIPLSLSSPDLVLFGAADRYRRRATERSSSSSCGGPSARVGLYDPISFTVSSVPECLNLYGGVRDSARSRHDSDNSLGSDNSSACHSGSYGYGYSGPVTVPSCTRESVASKNFNLYDLQQQQQQQQQQRHHSPAVTFGREARCTKTVTFQTGSGGSIASPARPKQNIRASYANLTALNYSDDDEYEDGHPVYGGRPRGHEYYLSRNTFRTSSGAKLGGGSRTTTSALTTAAQAPSSAMNRAVGNFRLAEEKKKEDGEKENSAVRDGAGAGEQDTEADDEESRIFPLDRDEKNVFNSLLEEISAHFDRNLSIINDQAEAYEPIAAFLLEQKSLAGATRLQTSLAGAGLGTSSPVLASPPQAPPRRTQIKTNPHHQQPQQQQQQSASPIVAPAKVTATSASVPPVTSAFPVTLVGIVAPKGPKAPLAGAAEAGGQKRTFDQDPTNLVTCYAASLERCTFDPSESTSNLCPFPGAGQSQSSDLHTNRVVVASRYSTVPVKREFVASTPNLNYYHGGDGGGGGGGGGDGGVGGGAEESDGRRLCGSALSVPDHHNSLRNVSSCRSAGILATGASATASSSRCGLSKGVSFCPIVSEIIWKSNSASDIEPDDNGSIISNQDFEIDIDDDDFDPDDYEHANLLTQTNTIINSNSVEQFEQLAAYGEGASSATGMIVTRNASSSLEAVTGSRAADHDDAIDDRVRPLARVARSEGALERDNSSSHYPARVSQLESAAPDASAFSRTMISVENGRANNALQSQQAQHQQQQPQQQQQQHPNQRHLSNGTVEAGSEFVSGGAMMTSTVMSARSNGDASGGDVRSGYGASEERGSVVGGGGGTEGHRGNNGGPNAGAMASKNLIVSESVEPGGNRGASGATTLPSQYSNSSLIKNFKNGKAEKKGKTFLSRISSGLRFSFRNKAKKGAALKETTFGVTPANNHGPSSGSQTVNGAPYNNNNNVKAAKAAGGAGKASTMPGGGGGGLGTDSASIDFIYIPLKDPRGQRTDESGAYHLRQMNTSGVTVDDSFTGAEDEPDDCEIAVTRPPGAPYRSDSSTALNGDGGSGGGPYPYQQHPVASASGGNHRAGANHVLSSKPPLPKLPPRVVGVCAKRSSTSPASAKHAHAHRASSTPPREIDGTSDHDEQDCSAGGGSYYRRSPSQQQYAASASPYSGADTVSVEGTLPSAALSRAHYADAYGDEYEQEEDDDGQRFYYGHQLRGSIMGSEQKIGLIETNLDTHETVISGKTRSLMELGGGPHHHHYRGGHHPGQATAGHQLSVHDPASSAGPGQRRTIGGGVGGQMNGPGGPGAAGEQRTNGGPGRPHKSMEFLLDKENQRNVLPPENELQKSHETGTNLSEHQLRVQASLQRLNIPDWYKQYSGKDGPANTTAPAPNTGAPGGILRKRNSDVGRWTGLSSKTTSLSSLGSHRSDRSPVMLSPSAHSHHGQTGFSRWSTSHLNSNQTSPSVSTRGSFTRGGLNASAMSGYSTASTTAGTAGTNSITGVGGPSTIRNSFRQPYLGWRSQEKLSQPRTPAERLASSLLQQQGNSSKQKEQHHQQQLKEQQQKGNRQQKEESVVTPEIQSSIIEVTSAIVHYVNDQTNRHSRSRSTSPSQRCWLESSFVGTRPLDSPQTPMIENSSVLGSSHQKQQHQQQQQQTAGDHYRFNAGMNGVGVPTMASAAATVPSFSLPPEHQSPGSATLEDVLASLLGLPADSHRSSVRVANPCLMPTAAAAAGAAANSSTINHTLQIEPMQTRRRSEGDAATRKRNDSGGSVAISSISATTTTTSGSTATQGGGGPRSVDLLGATLDARIARRVSLDSAEAAGHAGHAGHGGHGGHGGPQQPQHQLLKCRNPRCDASATLAEARRSYKSCHNCSHLYCSRECRRAHWERHRKACLHSRVSALCRLVLSTCKDDADSLRHLSALARRGYLSQGRGVVRILFRSPEAADSFIKQGFQCLGEVSYVRWPDLLPAEMGPELYSELLKLATEYKPDSKMLLYVAICVVSEAPGSATAGAVKWERQLVSRCAKLKLCRSVVSGELGATGAGGGAGAGGTGPGGTGTGGTGTGGERAAPARKDTVGDVLVLAFNILAQTTPRAREQVSRNVQAVLRQRGVHLRKHYPEVSQRLATFVEGSTDRFLPVTLHPRDAVSGRSFVCIIMPNYGDADRVQFPVSENSDDRVVTVDVGAADLGDDLTSKL